MIPLLFWHICDVIFLKLKGGDAAVNSIHLFPKNTEHIIVCNKTSSIYIMTLQGQVHIYLGIFHNLRQSYDVYFYLQNESVN